MCSLVHHKFICASTASLSLCLLLIGTTAVRPCCCPLSVRDLPVTVLLRAGLEAGDAL